MGWLTIRTRGATFEHEFTVKPKGIFTLLASDSRAMIEYRSGTEDPPQEKVGRVSGLGNIEVMTEKKYNKLTARYVVSLCGCFLVCKPMYEQWLNPWLE